jgi:two-component system response regulator FixJ
MIDSTAYDISGREAPPALEVSPGDGAVARESRGMERQPTIFLVEDDRRLCQMLAWFLESHDFRVVASGSIAEALANYEPAAHGCLVLDINLPEGTGLELLKEFRARGGDHPFVIMTAFSRVPLAVEAMRLGAVDFLEKPFKHESLLERVKEALAKDAAAREQIAEVDEIRRQISQLSPREWEISKLVALGMLSKEIAGRLGIKSGTVGAHRSNILAKLDFTTSAELSTLVGKALNLAAQGRLQLPE